MSDAMLRDAQTNWRKALDQRDALRADNERLRGLLREAREDLFIYEQRSVRGVSPESLIGRIDAALSGADQPAVRACTHPEGFTFCNWCGARATDPASAVAKALVDMAIHGVGAVRIEYVELRNNSQIFCPTCI